jgi:outer membrane protein assembly factor BamB
LLEQANSLGILADGKIAASEYFNGNLYLLDANGNLQQNLEGETKKVAPVVAAQGTKVAYIAKGAKSVVVMDTASGSKRKEYPYDLPSKFPVYLLSRRTVPCIYATQRESIVT